MSDVVHIGDATCYRADCFDILPDIRGADALITDPPYGCTSNAWDERVDLDLFWRHAMPAMKHNAACCIFAQMPFSVDVVQSNRPLFRYDLIYQKSLATGYLNANRMPLRAHEQILVFYRALPTYNPQKTPGKPYAARLANHTGLSKNYSGSSHVTTVNADGMRHPTSVIQIKSEPRFNGKQVIFHPTQKPLALMEWLIKTYTNPGDTVLDPFMGGGTTGIAALKNGCRFIGIEREEQYFDVACQRIQECTQEALSSPSQSSRQPPDYAALPLFANCQDATACPGG